MLGTIGEVRLVAFDFAPYNWAFCYGQLLNISTNTALFSIVGTMFGGDGRTTFGLPDLRGRVPIQPGTGPGLSIYHIGTRTGLENEHLSTYTLPTHNHGIDSSSLAASVHYYASTDDSNNIDDPEAAYMSHSASPMYAPTPNAPAGASTGVIGGSLTTVNTGGTDSHNNMQPFLALHYVICMFGAYPSRS